MRSSSGPFNALTRRTMPSSGNLPLPSALRTANTSDVNSWPPGTARKRNPVGAPSLSKSNWTSGTSGPCCTTLSFGLVVASDSSSESNSAWLLCWLGNTEKTYWPFSPAK